MKTIKLLVLALGISAAVSAQTIHKAKLAPSIPTESQKTLIRQGIQLHDEKKFDDAVELYKRVLDECSGCVLAMYEAGLSYYGKKDSSNALKYLEEATKYKGDLLPDVYRLIGSIIDDRGEREKALKIFGKALKLAPNNQIIHYDMGVTLARMSRFDDSKKSLKTSIELSPGYASPHYILAEVFTLTKYRVPAMLAAARVISLEIATPRSKRANEIFMSVFQGNTKKDAGTGNLTILLKPDGPKDEGDFGALELALGLSGAASEIEENKDKTNEEKFVSNLKTFTAIATESEMKPNFVKDQYISFLAELQKRDYVEPLAYLIMYQNGNEKADVWINANGPKVIEFTNWAKGFRP